MKNRRPHAIADARKASGMTQQELADAVGAHWITISKLERGKIKLTTEWLEKLAGPLGVNVRDLLPNEGLWLGFAEPSNIFSVPKAVRLKRPPPPSTSLIITGSAHEPLLHAGDTVQLLPLTNLTAQQRKRAEGKLAFDGTTILSSFGFLYPGRRRGIYDLLWFGNRVVGDLKASNIFLVETISFHIGQT